MTEISEFEGVEVGDVHVEPLIKQSLQLVQSMLPDIFLGVSKSALIAALGTSSALLAMASAKCRLAVPPSDISAVTDSSGNLVLRCEHNPPHEWNYGSGARTP